jgi:hypothetical protein
MVNLRFERGAEKRPSSKLISSPSAPRTEAATALALATILSVARWTADPPSAAERDPPVPSPIATFSVSPWT